MNITVTEKAAEKINRLFEAHRRKGGAALRVTIRAADGCGSCGSLHYGLSVEKQPRAEDEKYEVNGVPIVVDPDSQEYLDGTRIDYRDSLLKGGFILDNPARGDGCSCSGH
ncbi:MAG: HesB/IscA family protein [Phycisphaerae bacterium]